MTQILEYPSSAMTFLYSASHLQSQGRGLPSISMQERVSGISVQSMLVAAKAVVRRRKEKKSRVFLRMVDIMCKVEFELELLKESMAFVVLFKIEIQYGSGDTRLWI